MKFSIIGNIGSGKSTLLSSLESAGFNVVYEPVNQWSFLPLFYKDMSRWGFTFQVQVLNSFIQQQHSGNIFERSSWESCYIFGKNLYQQKLISAGEYELLCDLNAQMGYMPDIFIFLDTNVNDCFQRIKQRNRECEQITDSSMFDYIKSLDFLYKSSIHYLKNNNKIVYTIDGSLDIQSIKYKCLNIIKKHV